MGYPDGLQLDIGVESDAFKDVGRQVLVRVTAEPAFEIAEVEVGVRCGVEVAENAALMPTVSRLAPPSRRASPPETLSSRELTRASSCPGMR